MCLNLKPNAKPKIAEKDIIVYKFGKINNDGTFSPAYRDEFRYFKNQPTSKVDIEVWGNEIYEGYHSFLTEEGAGINKLEDEIIQRFIIPAGTTYYEGTFCGCWNFVSEVIIWGPEESPVVLQPSPKSL